MTSTLQERQWSCPQCGADYTSPFGMMTCGDPTCVEAECRKRGYFDLLPKRENKRVAEALHWKALGVPAAFAEAELRDFGGMDGWQNRRSVRILGAPGRGKTHLAVALLKAAVRKGASGLFVSAPQYLKAIKSTYRKGSRESERDVLEEHARPDVLVLDDFGAAAGTDFGWSEYLMLLEARGFRVGTTVITTNLTLAEIHTAEPRIASRLQNWRLIELTGADRRNGGEK